MKIVFVFLFSVIALLGQAQSMRDVQLIRVTQAVQNSSAKNLEAIFTANVTQGEAPLKIQFADQSNGSPTSWKWTFGDGGSSKAQNPQHTYWSKGNYTVKLVVSDSISSDSLEKKEYIKIESYTLNCDTLNYPLPKPLSYFYLPNKGYILGNNSYKDKAVCDYFENIQPNLAITGLLCHFSKGIQASGHNERIAVNIWEYNNIKGDPGNIIGSDTLFLSEIVNDVKNDKLTTINFKNPVQAGNSFFMGIVFPILAGDTVCLWSTDINKVEKNTAWILNSDNRWQTVKDIYTPPLGPDFSISSAIYPKVCKINRVNGATQAVQFAIWPNPAHNEIYIINQDQRVEKLQYAIIAISGKKVLSGNISKSFNTTVDVSLLPSGIYFVHVFNNEFSSVSKLIIQ